MSCDARGMPFARADQSLQAVNSFQPDCLCLFVASKKAGESSSLAFISRVRKSAMQGRGGRPQPLSQI